MGWLCKLSKLCLHSLAPCWHRGGTIAAVIILEGNVEFTANEEASARWLESAGGSEPLMSKCEWHPLLSSFAP